MTKFKTLTALAALSVAMPRGFDGDAEPGWKIGEGGAVEMRDGNPVYRQADGSEAILDAGVIARLNGEAKTHRTEKEKALEKLKAYEGIDPAKAREAFDKLSKIDQKALIDAGEVDRVKGDIEKTYKGEIETRDGTINELRSKLANIVTQNAFANSDFVRDNVAVPVDMLQATFGQNFKVEDDKLIPHGPDGKPILSKKRLGEVADFEEGIQILIENYKYKDRILAADRHSGSGSTGGGNGRGASKYISRADFEKLSPPQQAEVAGKMRAGEMAFKN
jgi:DNA-directed RNA polymerase subunit F